MDYDDQTATTVARDSAGGTVRLGDSTETRIHRPDPGGDTVGIFKKTAGYEPVVGWLVCTSGDQKGRDYRIKPGVNEIGRDPESAVSIALGGADMAISRRWHAVIEYFNEENEFYINRKDNPEVWRNDSRVLTLTKLDPFDRLLFGTTPYIFIPLCSEKFKWALDEESSS
ncbi:MAG: FHA domain-containing protein [Desulfarculaceae bacterium]|nr:FHA domain-containing protein [Desulfarculaceae bacterium]MCF8072134.1 FHA domain-containing protein [Desulfarculaceae bacterium]MCF8100055.1 FHA domain-containing protein [Desulfarculaceae bacterium]MCF8118262.1 FHA domain-containing protein [Desulfarculaceae bacterium]